MTQDLWKKLAKLPNTRQCRDASWSLTVPISSANGTAKYETRVCECFEKLLRQLHDNFERARPVHRPKLSKRHRLRSEQS